MGLSYAIMYSAPVLNAVATSNAVLYQRNACNYLDSSLEKPVDLGTLKTDQTQLSASGQVSRQNATHYYKFNLDGDSLKLDISNATNTSQIKVQILDRNGAVIADNEGTDEQKAAYENMTSWDGHKLKAGEYYAKVSYGITALKTNPQTYNLSLYSGTVFSKAYQTTAVSQTSLKQKVAVDNTMVFAASDAKYFTHQDYNRVNGNYESAINIGWLFENKAALGVNSKITQTNPDQYYTFTLQKGKALKMAFNNLTDTAKMRVQITDSTGYSVFADSHGTAAQKKAYEKIMSSEGMKARTGQYSIKVSFAPGANRQKQQSYSFTVYSGTTYNSLYKTTASAETYDTAKINGTLLTGNYDSASAAASYLYGLAQGDEVDIFSTLSSMA